jgi:predicted dehydrogenase
MTIVILPYPRPANAATVAWLGNHHTDAGGGNGSAGNVTVGWRSRAAVTPRLKVGVVGCGLIAQIMHLPYLRELSELYEVAALCDLSETTRNACARRFGVERTFSDWRDLVAEPLDAVLVLTSGSHAPVAVAAAQAGRHVFVEKPMCFSVGEGREMIHAAARAGVRLMIGYPLRYDPAYQRLAKELEELNDLRMVRITTLESPIPPYVAHYPLVRGDDIPSGDIQMLLADNDMRLTAAIGDEDDLARQVYQSVLLDTLVHEFNAVRGLLGEPERLAYVDLRQQTVTGVLEFANAQCVLTWIDLPGIARYEMEFAFYAPQRRLTLKFPSPFLRSMPTSLVIEGGEAGGPRSWQTSEVVAYDEAFKRELVAFHDSVTGETDPLTPGMDGLRDIALCEAAVVAFRERVPYPRPTQRANGISAMG